MKTTFTAAQKTALLAALKDSNGVFAGWNPGGPTVSAHTLTKLASLGLMTLGKTSANETYGRLTPAGVEAAKSVVP